MTRAPEDRRLRRSAKALVLAGALAASTGLSLATASTASAAPTLGVGEVASSGMTLLANLPKRGAFAPEGAFNSDLAFSGDKVFAGNYEGFTVYDVANPRKPREVVQLVCPGSQNDISVHGDLLVLSVDSRRTDDSCNSRSLSTTRPEKNGDGSPNQANIDLNNADRAQLQSGSYWEGIRLFDISDPAKPKYLKAVETDCGSHTHTLVPHKQDLFIYVSSYDVNVDAKDCRTTDDKPEVPGNENETAHDIISVVKVPGGSVKGAKAASVVNEPKLFNPGAAAVPASETRFASSQTRGCHDITAYPAKGIAAGACMGEGVIMDISDPVNPKLQESVTDPNFAFWHSATFNNAATTVMYTDELGGGGAATCNPEIGPVRGANAYYTLGADRQLTKQGYFKIPRTQSAFENCVAHNGSLVPTKTRDVMVQAWYQGGISVVDFTNPAKPTELAWFDRGPLSAERLILGGSWSAYYYNGFVYSNDIQKGLDVLEITVPVAKDKPGRFTSRDYNPQSQTKI